MQIFPGVYIHANQESKTLFQTQAELVNFNKASQVALDTVLPSEHLDGMSTLISICSKHVYFYEITWEFGVMGTR